MATMFLRPRVVVVRSRLDLPGVAVPGVSRDIRIQIATTRSDWEQAFQLVADNYQARGFEAGGGDYRFTTHHALPETIVLVAKEGTRVVATLSLVPDSVQLGLPLESLYGDELSQLRRQGRRMVETTCLADRGLSAREFVQVFTALMQLGWQYWNARGYRTNVITVSPRHAAFYTRLLGYQRLGPRRAYAQVQGAPAEAFYLDPELMQAHAPAMHQRIFGQRLPANALNATPMPPDLVRHFAQRSSQTSLAAVERVLRRAGGVSPLRGRERSEV